VLLAQAQLAAVELRRLLAEVDGGEHRVGHALGGIIDRRRRVGDLFARRELSGAGEVS
jgi:hypothetical protein